MAAAIGLSPNSRRCRLLRVQRAAPASAPLMVGRDEELAQIRQWFAAASQGSRRVVFVTGEPGIGKTIFARSFLADLAYRRLARIGCGQCVEQYGAGEPYMPVLEALTRLAQEPDGDKLVEILRRLAPTWLAQMPALVTAARAREAAERDASDDAATDAARDGRSARSVGRRHAAGTLARRPALERLLDARIGLSHCPAERSRPAS